MVRRTLTNQSNIHPRCKTDFHVIRWTFSYHFVSKNRIPELSNWFKNNSCWMCSHIRHPPHDSILDSFWNKQSIKMPLHIHTISHSFLDSVVPCVLRLVPFWEAPDNDLFNKMWRPYLIPGCVFSPGNPGSTLSAGTGLLSGCGVGGQSGRSEPSFEFVAARRNVSTLRTKGPFWSWSTHSRSVKESSMYA